jgi:hypothetical protein
MVQCLIKHRDNFTLIEFEVLLAVSMKSMIFWVVMPCSSESLTFWRKICPHSAGTNRKPSRKQAEVGGKLSFAILEPQGVGDMFL